MTQIPSSATSPKTGVDRRQFLKDSSLATVAIGTLPLVSMAAADAGKPKFTLAPLPYAFDALEPHIDAKTMEIHHGKHHAAYVNNLNKALEGVDVGQATAEQLIQKLDTLPEAVRQTVRNNAGGHVNHTLFWQLLKKDGGAPTGELKSAIELQLGGAAKFQEDFTKAAMGRFGSGWAWLSVDPHKKLVIESTANQDSPVTTGNTPILGLDVWEHAYYLKYQNRRADYVAAFFSIIHWAHVADLYAAAMKG